MNEDQLIALLSSIEDDSVDEEIDTLLKGVEIDMDAIKEKSQRKLNAIKKKTKLSKRIPYVAAACIGILGITTVYAGDISEAIKSFLNITPVYSTIINGKAYYLKETYALDEHIKLESMTVSKGKLEMEFSSDLSMETLGTINIIAKDQPSIVYGAGGYSEEGNKYFISFMNQSTGNYDIKPFKDFELKMAGKSYAVSLDEGQNFNENSKIYTDNSNAAGVKGVNVGARIVEGSKDKLNVQLVASFDDQELVLSTLGLPIQSKVISKNEDLGAQGMFGSSTSSAAASIYVFDGANNKYELKVPKDAKGSPVTVFETNAPKDQPLTVKLPAIMASYHKTIETFSITVPKEGEVKVDKTIDLGMQKAVVKSVKRLSPTSAEIVFDLNIGDNNKVQIRDFNLHSPKAKKIEAVFEGNKASATIEFSEGVDSADLEISYPNFVINGNWTIDIPKA